MANKNFKTPILLLVFNRPDFVLQQLDHLRFLKPSRLFISGDGPRPGNATDIQGCQAVKEALKTVDWPCQLQTHFSTINRGCRIGVSEGIDWFFSQVEAGIILEDDCFTDFSFFSFAEELLYLHSRNDRVMHISGANFQNSQNIANSYYFSQLPHCWGWATWKRAWRKYELDLKSWPTEGQEVLQGVFKRNISRQYWANILNKMYLKQIDTWDYQWLYSIWKNHGISITPQTNLVTNIGFDSRSTHTTVAFSPLAFQAIVPLTTPLIHPENFVVSFDLDDETQRFFESPLFFKLLSGLTSLLKRKMNQLSLTFEE